jgi:hypothetical protein
MQSGASRTIGGVRAADIDSPRSRSLLLTHGSSAAILVLKLLDVLPDLYTGVLVDRHQSVP